MYIDTYMNEIIRDKLVKPIWERKVNRWHQLDDEAYCMAEAVSRNTEFFRNFDFLILTSPDVSGHTDSLFTHADKFSPSYFVHTLPNVRSLSLSLVLDWEGPIICTSCGERSLSKALDQAIEYVSIERFKYVIVASVNRIGERLFVDFYKINKQEGKFQINRSKYFSEIDDLKLREELLNEKNEINFENKIIKAVK